MGRNRRMPPLFEVMRQTNPGSPQAGSGGAGAPGGGGPGSDPVRNQAFFRAQGQPESVGNAALRLTPHHPETEEGAPRPTPASPASAAPAVPKPVEVRVGQARRNWVVEDTSSRAPDAEGDQTAAPAPGRARATPAKGTLPIPGTWIAAAAAIAVSLLVIVWIVAYRQGSSAKQQEFQDKLSNSAPAGPTGSPAGASKPPSGPGTPGSSGTVPQEHRQAREPDGTNPAKIEPTPKPSPTPVPAPAPAATDPAPAVDPRQADTNYLSLLTFREKDEAVELAKFLTAGGLPTATVALKSSGGASVGWEVFVLQGIPSAEFRRADDRRNAIHRKLEDLGKKWNQEHPSRLNLSRDNVTWRKFKPGS